MGYITAKCWRIGQGHKQTTIEVEEPAGFAGEWITPAGQVNQKRKFRVKRCQREIKTNP